MTFAPDEIDWDDEVRLAVESRAALSPDALTGMEANLRFVGPETMETKIFGRLTAWQNWIFQRPNAVGEKGALTSYGTRTRRVRLQEDVAMISADKIPNNVNLSAEQAATTCLTTSAAAALEHWQPKYIQWWKDMGPQGFQDYHQVYVRTAVSVDPSGWAHFEYVKLPEYRWGIFLADPVVNRTIGFGDFFGPAGVAGSARASSAIQLRRLIVTQGDTEPASVEQQRWLGHRCPSLYDLRNLFQVNVEEGRHLWAMVYLLHSYFGRDGRDEAEELLARQSGNRDKPRILEAFNEPIDTWLDFFMFTMFTDRDGKSQLLSLSESSLDPLSRTTRFMLTEEAHHMFVGETGIARIVERTCQLMKEAGFSEDVRALGGIDLPTIQKHINLWFSLSLDLHGNEISTNAASYFANGLKGRAEEAGRPRGHSRRLYKLEVVEDGGERAPDMPMRNAMNEVLRDWYVGDCQAGVDRWNKIFERHGLSDRLRLPDRKFNRGIGMFAGFHFDPDGRLAVRGGMGAPEARVAARAVRQGVPAQHHEQRRSTRPGKFANYIAPPQRGVKGKPINFEYDEMHDGRNSRSGPMPNEDSLHHARRRRHDRAERSAGEHLSATR